jgi:hypothetical protein
MNYEKLMQEAKITNTERDQIDHSCDFASPNDCSNLMLLRTAMTAIECGIRSDDWGFVAEGQVMLQQLENRVKEEI